MDKLKSGAAGLGLHLIPEQLEQFEVYYRELVDWNKRVNLTSITDYEEAQVIHFLDSLTVVLGLDSPATGSDLKVIDVGSGAGFPGLPLRIVFPSLRLVLLEATARKVRFLEHIVAKLGLENVEIVAGRAEEAAHRDDYREKFDVAVSRAVAPLSVLAELVLPFCAVGGRIIAPKKGSISSEIDRASKAIAALGGELNEVKEIKLEEFKDSRYLVIINKINKTPDKYPRRPGIPAKRPIL
jgi:16S rRNA (guanine527-N7)-methyltransferase